MSLAYHAPSSYNSGSSAVSSFTFTLPTFTAGDLVLVSGLVMSGSGTWSESSGTWTFLDTGTANTSGKKNFTSFLAYKVAGAGEANPTFTFSGTAAFTVAHGDSWTPDAGQAASVDTWSSVVSSAAGTSFTPASLTAAGSGEVSVIHLLAVAAANGTTNVTFTDPGSYVLTSGTHNTPAGNQPSDRAESDYQAGVSGTVTPGAFTANVSTGCTSYAVLVKEGSSTPAAAQVVIAPPQLIRQRQIPPQVITGPAPAGGSPITVTATQGGSTANGMALRVMVLTQAAATQNGASGQVSSSGAGQVGITTTQAGSRVYGAALRASSTAPAVNGVTAQLDSVPDSTHGAWYGTWEAASLTGTPGATTFGYTTTFLGGIAGLEILTAGTLTEDASGPAVASTLTAITVSTASFIPPAGSLLVALVSSNGAAAQTTMTVSDGSLTWTEAVAGNTAGDGYVGVWIAQVPAGSGPPATAQAVITAPGQPARKPQLIPPQVITGTLANASGAGSGTGSGAVPGSQVTVIPAAQASGHGSAAVTHIAVSSADSAAGAAGVPVVRPQASGTADSGHGSAQGQIHVSAAASGHGTAGVLAAGQLSEAVTRAPQQPARLPVPRQFPQVITGPVSGPVHISSSDAGHGAGAVTHIALNGADSAAAAAGVPAIRPQAAGTADSGHGSAQGAVKPEAAAAGRGAGAAAQIKPEAAGTGSGHGNPAIGVSSTDAGHGSAGTPAIRVSAAGAGHGAGAVTSLNTGAITAAIRALLHPLALARIPPQVITGPAGTGPVVVTAADTGRGTGSDFFFISSADSAIGAGHGVIHVSAAASGHGAGTSLSRWPASADTGTGQGAALSRWPSSADTGHGTGRALNAWPSSVDTGAGHGAVMRIAVDAAAASHGTDSYGDLDIWTLLPPSWSERRGLVWITARLEDGELLELASGLPPSRELLELARQVSSGPVRLIRAADSGRARAQVPRGIAAVTVWVTGAAQVAVWVEG